MTDFDAIDFFRDRAFIADPYPYFEFLRGQCPVRRESHHDVVMVTGYEEAIAVFKSNVERYPASANVYDSLAEAYERSSRLDLAMPNYEKAYTLGKENSDPNQALYKANLDRVAEKLKQGTASKTN